MQVLGPKFGKATAHLFFFFFIKYYLSVKIMVVVDQPQICRAFRFVVEEMHETSLYINNMICSMEEKLKKNQFCALLCEMKSLW